MRHLWPDERATDREAILIKGQGCRCGRRAGKAIELTQGGLRHVPILELSEPQGDLAGAQVGHAVGKAD